MLHFIYKAIHYPARSKKKAVTERTTNEYLYVKVMPILEFESRDLWPAFHIRTSNDCAIDIPELINASLGNVSTFTTDLGLAHTGQQLAGGIT
jgi:hypothetical protein